MSKSPQAPKPHLPGLTLSRRYYQQAVRPILADAYPRLVHSAALLGPGSEVLGYDTDMSTDHSWGPRLLLFVSPSDHGQIASELDGLLEDRLPRRFCGLSTRFHPPSPDEPATWVLAEPQACAAVHRVEIHAWHEWLEKQLGVDLIERPTAHKWLVTPQQELLAVARGEVYHDGLGIDADRAKLSWYPRDVWLYLMASGWARLGQEEHLMGRAGWVGDELGAAVIAGRMVREIMRLGFLIERRYAPYPKWFGTAFGELECAGTLKPALDRALVAQGWRDRESEYLSAARGLAQLHAKLGIGAALDAEPRAFFDRPFRVIDGDRFARALLAEAADSQIRRLADGPLIGGIDQWSDSTDLVCASSLRAPAMALYDASTPPQRRNDEGGSSE
jgi:hypothetical protein